jgi:hypothetical protein
MNKARRIMNQFRWMDSIVDCDRLCMRCVRIIIIIIFLLKLNFVLVFEF